MPVSAIEQAKVHSKNASLASLDGDLEQALRELILASELYVKAIKEVKGDQELRRHLQELFDETAEEAERIKERQRRRTTRRGLVRLGEEPARTGTGSYVRPPMQYFAHCFLTSRAVTKKEQVLLLQASKLQETICPIWNEAKVDQAMQCDAPFETPVAWAPKVLAKAGIRQVRLSGLFAQPLLESTDCCLYPTLRQNVLNDCSFVCALIVADQWSNRFRTQLPTSSLYPRDAQGSCIVSSMGKYMAKIWLNGSERQVVIDDRLPVPASGKVDEMLVFSESYKEVVWPALLEKMYYTIKGAEFAGSNSASDLYLITGWLPEEIHLRAAGVDLDALWTQLEVAWKQGHVLITTGSCRRDESAQENGHVVPSHSYAVIGVQVAKDVRTLSIQDPWGPKHCHGQSVQEISFDKVALIYNALYLNWDPRLWRFRELRHFRRQQDYETPSPICLYHYPQMVLENASDKPVDLVLVLSRHTAASQPHSGLAIFQNRGIRQMLDWNSLITTDYSASADITLRCSLPAKAQYTVVLLQNYAAEAMTYTVAVHHNEQEATVQLKDVRDQHLRSEDLHVFEGSWINATAGGSANHATYLKNPQFTVDLSEPSQLVCTLETNSTASVQIDLVHLPAGVSRVVNPRGKDHIASGKAYERTSTAIQIQALQPGRYALVCSTWQPATLADFRLTILCKPVGSDTWKHHDRGPIWQVVAPLGYGRSHLSLSDSLSTVCRTRAVHLTSPAQNTASIYLHTVPSRQRVRVTLLKRGILVADVEGESSLALEPVKLGVLPAGENYELKVELLGATSAREVAYTMDIYATQPVTEVEKAT